MIFGLELVHYRLQLSILPDDKSRAQDAVELSPHELLRAPSAVFVRRCMILVTQQLKIQSIALDKLGELDSPDQD